MDVNALGGPCSGKQLMPQPCSAGHHLLEGAGKAKASAFIVTTVTQTQNGDQRMADQRNLGSQNLQKRDRLLTLSPFLSVSLSHIHSLSLHFFI